MQQQTRQRTRRKRKSTPLPEKRRRKKQTTRSSHANTTHQHMVNPPPPFHNNKKDGARRKTGSREKRGAENTTKEKQWCSGITCVLAQLRAHYPEHHQQERWRRKRRRRRRQTKRPHSHRYFDPHTNHHRYSTMTQPCHKNTTLNQQCRDREHKRWEGEGESGTQFLHRTSPPTTNTTTQDRRGTGAILEGTEQCEGERHNARCRTQSEHGATRSPPPRHSTGPQGKQQGGHQHTDGESVTLPPFTHHATHHPRQHATIHDGPTHHHCEGGAHRGYPTTRTAHTYTHHPHTTHLAMEHCAT